MGKKTLKLGLIIPWFGKDLVGGAELYSYHLSHNLAAMGHDVEVLTTCCRRFQDPWDSNFYESGVSTDGRVRIRRFRVEKRNAARFNVANEALMAFNNTPKIPHGSFFPENAGASFFVDNIHSCELMNFLGLEAESFDAFLFIPYLYGPILMGLPIVAQKAYLIPCLHDETYAYLPDVSRVFSLARGLFFISEGEFETAMKIFGPYVGSKSKVIGGGVEVTRQDEATAPKALELGDAQDFLLYLGRKDDTKNTSELLQEFDRFLRHHPNARLVLAGPGDLKNLVYRLNDARVADLGIVSDSEKIWLLKHCRALVQPSKNESFSRTMMEAWTFRKPVLVHGECRATAMATLASKAGWICHNSADWQAALSQVFDPDSQSVREELGANAVLYADANGSWLNVAAKLEDTLLCDLATSKRQLGKKLKIHQIMPGFTSGDAISNQAIILRRILRSLGFESDIYAAHIIGYASRKLTYVKTMDEFVGSQDCAIIYHHSTFFPQLEEILALKVKKIMIYHNVTPAEYFSPWNFIKTREMNDGRLQIRMCLNKFDHVVAASLFSANELKALGFINVQAMYLGVDPIRWSNTPCRKTIATYMDGYLNFLFVGRVAPNKCQHDLIMLFAEIRKRKPLSRLLLVGSYDEWDSYYQYLRDLIREHGLENYVIFASHVTEAELHAYYRIAHAFVCMSEHEGFCVPLVEAQQFSIPTYAFASSAVTETAVEARLLFNHKHTAEIATQILNNLEQPRYPSTGDALRKFSYERMVKAWTQLLDEWIADEADEVMHENSAETEVFNGDLPPSYMHKLRLDSIKRHYIPEIF